MIPISVIVTGRGTVSFKVKGEYSPGNPSGFSKVFRPVVTWNMTYKCNLNCAHCYINAGPDKEDIVSTEEGKRIIDQIANIGSPLLIMSGGEPLMRRDFLTLAYYAKSKGLRLALSTNGTLISERIAKELKEIGFMYVGVSLDSPDPAWHDKFRGMKNAFSMTINGIRNAINAGLDVGLRFTLTRDNIDLLDDYMSLALSLGVSRITFYHISASGRGKNLKDMAYSPVQYKKFMDKLIDYAKKLKGRVEIETTLGTFDGIYLAKGEEDLDFVAESGGCGRKMISIYPDGTVYPCQFVDFSPLGNVREKDLKEIIRNIPEIFTNPVNLINGKKCSSCKYLAWCRGGDRVRAYYWGGDLLGDDPLCPINEVKD
ncbi:radical SAM protein [Candidatus Acidianus copahuensis]|uniref:Radical SAM protein n=1 Tax=Candidatus Acidianus copahuensis TaxID=1160895 RepID=A0A031LU92_9CREN|nr:radical SAM protein [Candidatus Acidianus copahuensis]EZQ10693.1 radical SAM protein [Candidatus Acidianus copahuensis]